MSGQATQDNKRTLPRKRDYVKSTLNTGARDARLQLCRWYSYKIGRDFPVSLKSVCIVLFQVIWPLCSNRRSKTQLAAIMNLMRNAKLAVPPEFDAAPKNQRIAFVQELWDRIAQDSDQIPVPDHHKRVLDKRLNAYRASPQAGRPWSEVREELLAKLSAP